MREGNYQIINGDCLEVMHSLPDGSFDLVITSPPYNLGEGMENKGGYRIGHKDSRWNRQKVAGSFSVGYGACPDNLPYPEYVKWQEAVLAECWRLIAPNGAIFYNHKPRVVGGVLRHPLSLVGGLPVRQVIIWDRGSGFNYNSGAYMPMCEWILLIAKPNFQLRDKGASGIGDVWTFPPDGKNREHPASFPVELPRRILETNRGLRVLDPFAGSCTTGIACIEQGRLFTGIELDPFYCELGEARIRRAMGEGVDIPVRVTVDKVGPLFEAMG